jgi:hypothetical protein
VNKGGPQFVLYRPYSGSCDLGSQMRAMRPKTRRPKSGRTEQLRSQRQGRCGQGWRWIMVRTDAIEQAAHRGRRSICLCSLGHSTRQAFRKRQLMGVGGVMHGRSIRELPLLFDGVLDVLPGVRAP